MSRPATEVPSERIALQTLLDGPAEGLTRAQLQQRTGLSPATLVTLLKQPKGDQRGGRLVELNVVDVEEDLDGQARVRIRADAACVVGLDLGRHHIRAALGDATGRPLLRSGTNDLWTKTDDAVVVESDPYTALDKAAELVSELLHDAQPSKEQNGTKRPPMRRLAGIGVSVTSSIEPETGMFRPGVVASDWEGLRLQSEISERLEKRGVGCRLVVDKDSNLAALAQLKNAAETPQNFIFVKWASGVSAGIALDGAVRRGVNGSAGALGHSPLVEVREKQDEEPPPSEIWRPEPAQICRRCGKADCLEVMIGVERLRRVVAELRHEQAAIDDPRHWPTIEIIQERALSDTSSIEAVVLRAAAKRLGNMLGTVANLLNPSLIVIGGLFSDAHSDLLKPRVRHGIRDVASAPAYRDVEVKFATAGIIEGALASVASSGLVADFLLANS